MGYQYCHNGYCYFKCLNCWDEFKLRSTNRFVSTDQFYRCSSCKRKARLIPLIGERNVFKRIRYDAKKAGREFSIGFNWFVEKIHEECHYCGETDGNCVTVKSKIPGETLVSNFRYNGLDRIDNSVGYVEYNCVPCCFICNRAKNSMGYDAFIGWIDNLILYRLGPN